MSSSIRVVAPAKINLSLHVTGRRDDGYHLLDSLVVFADVGDEIRLRPSAETHLRVRGRFSASVPEGADNLVLRAAHLMGVRAEVALDKHLPVGAGIGGGSSDAAAVLRGLAAMTGRRLPSTLALGADVPVCVAGRPARMRGVGDFLQPVPPLPALPMVLVFPNTSVSTAEVFRLFGGVEGGPMPECLPGWSDAEEAAYWLRDQRNDLQAAAIRVAPAIADALAALDACGDCLLARMSGSGSTVFGLFHSNAAASRAALRIGNGRPDWWVRVTSVLDAAPEVQERRLTT